MAIPEEKKCGVILFSQSCGLYKRKGKVTNVDCLIEKLKFYLASWMLNLPHFQDFSIDQFFINWKDVAFASVGDG